MNLTTRFSLLPLCLAQVQYTPGLRSDISKFTPPFASFLLFGLRGNSTHSIFLLELVGYRQFKTPENKQVKVSTVKPFVLSYM